MCAPEGADTGYEYFQPTAATASVWTAAIQHGGPPTGLLVRAMENAVGGTTPPDGLGFSRVTMEILGAIGYGVSRVRTWIPRPGRQISQVAAELSEQQPDGTFRIVGRTTAWRLLRRDSSSISRTPHPPLPLAPGDLATTVGFPTTGENATSWGTLGFIGTIEVGLLDGRTGTTPALWIRPTLPLVAGEETSDLASAFTVIDVANGVGSDLPTTEWSWMNTDTTVHLIRAPRGPWVGLDATLAAGPDGYGATLGDLYDADGFLGRSAQTVLLSPTS
ncbi:MAG: thioesterase family protein [Gordonia sp. (in: high G+C Gram-positive bacteria)]|uniref:thioesterase family protein n=1 Tax=Gordonia sp. (in: high G+C Gram-positive bacteria) TaxID=84139 RepID=UPI003BB60AB9